MSIIVLNLILMVFSGCTPGNQKYRQLVNIPTQNALQVKKIVAYYYNQRDIDKLSLTAYVLDLLPYQFRLKYSVLSKFGDTIHLTAPISVDSLEILRHRSGYKLAIDTIHFINEFSADSIIRQIEKNCELRKRFRWFKSIPINQYCEQVFPYAVNNEAFKDYKEPFQKRYLPNINDVLLDNLDTNAVLAEYLTPYFESRNNKESYINEFTSTLGYYDQKKGVEHIKDTEDAEILHVYALRALGVPCTLEYTPYLEPFREGDSFVHIFDTKGSNYFKNKSRTIYANRVAKFYQIVSDPRKAKNPFVEIYRLGIPLQDIPLSLNIPKMIDITRERTKTFRVVVPVPENQLANKILYLATGHPGNWKIVSWSKINLLNKTATFENMGVNMSYQLTGYKNGIIDYINRPFVVEPSGRLQSMVIDGF